MAVTYLLRLTDDYIIESYSRHRARQHSRWFRWIVKLICAVGMLALLAFGIYADIAVVIGISAFFLLLLLTGPQFDYFILRRRWRRIPQYNDDLRIVVSEQHLASSSSKTTATSEWSAYIGALQFSDGVLLYSAPWDFFWLPDSAIVAGTPGESRAILNASISNYNVV